MTTANGMNGMGKPTYEQLREQRRHLRAQIQVKQLERQAKLLESYGFWSDDYEFGGSDTWFRLRGDDGQVWLPIATPSDRARGANWPLWRTPPELDRIRQRSRTLCASNAYARGLVRNATNQTIGKGYGYKCQAREIADQNQQEPGVQANSPVERLVAATQDCVDYFLKLNRWNGQVDPRTGILVVAGTREREIYSRQLRDGDVYLRFFGSQDGSLHVRFVEPECVKDPPGARAEDGWSFGERNQVEPFEDVETIEEYCIHYATPGAHGEEWERVSAENILHLKGPDTDSTVKRALPFFCFDVAEALERAAKLQRCVSTGAAIRASIAETQQYENAAAQQVSGLADSLKTTTRTDPYTGGQDRIERIRAGTIRRVGGGWQVVTPPSSTGVEEQMEAVRGDLRQAGAAGCAPEFWLGDTSGGNYSNLESAAAPAVRNGETEQEYYKAAFLAVVWKAVRWAVECGKLPQEALVYVDIQVDAPDVIHRDELQATQVKHIEHQNGVLSPQTWCAETGRDYEIESANLLEDAKRKQAMMPQQPPGMDGGQFTGPDQGGPDGGGEEDGRQGGTMPRGPEMPGLSTGRFDMRSMMRESRDAAGHEHKGSGPGGGQFTGGAGGEASSDPDEARAAKARWRAGQKERHKALHRHLRKHADIDPWMDHFSNLGDEKTREVLGSLHTDAESALKNPHVPMETKAQRWDWVAQAARRRAARIHQWASKMHGGHNLPMSHPLAQTLNYDLPNLRAGAKAAEAKAEAIREFARQENRRPVQESKDSSGHEHKGKGPGGGQFTGSGGGDAGGKGDNAGMASQKRLSADEMEVVKESGLSGQAEFDALQAAMRRATPDDLNKQTIVLWHGTSLKGAKGIVKSEGLRYGERGMNASADIGHAMQYPEDTGAQSLVLLRADTSDLGVDPNDQIGETVEDGLFPKGGHGSSATVGRHEILAVIDIETDVAPGVSAALEKGDLYDALEKGATVIYKGPSLLPAKPMPGTKRVTREARSPVHESRDPAPDDDTQERAELIADLLAGVFGEDAESLFDQVHDHTAGASHQHLSEGLLLEAWSEIQHPRGPNGRFIEKGSPAAVGAAHEAIKKGLAGDRTPEGVKALTEYLGNLTVKQLHEIKAHYGLKASGRVKAALAARIVEKLHGAKETAGKAGVQGKAEAQPWKAGGGEPEPGKVYNAPTEELHADPGRFQFKLNVNKEGVTPELQGVKTFNPDFAGVVSVWKDPQDGKTWVVNGHHRFELAKRTGHPNLAVRYLDAPDAQTARAAGALINIAEGRGTAIDAAKFMRDTGRGIGDLEQHGISLKGKLAQDAVTLTALNDRAFDRVARGTLDPTKALAVAKHLHDHDLQDQLFRLLDKREDEGKDLAPRVIEEMARQFAATPTTQKGGDDMFGSAYEDSVFVERAEVAAHVRSELSKEVNDFLVVASKRRAEKLGKAGNALNPEENRRIAQEADRVRNVYDQLLNRKGDISDAVNQAAVDLAKAKGKKERDAVKQRAIENVRDAVFREAGIGKTDGPSMGSGGEGGPAAPPAEPAAGKTAPDAGRGDNAPAGVGGSLEDHERSIVGRNREHGFLFTPDGKKLAELHQQSDDTELTLSADDEKKAKGAVLTHNHPKHTAPSVGDFFQAGRLDLRQLRVVTKDGVHVLDRPAGGWPPQREIESASDAASGAAVKATDEAKAAGRFSSPGEATAFLRQETVQRLADALGIPYSHPGKDAPQAGVGGQAGAPTAGGPVQIAWSAQPVPTPAPAVAAPAPAAAAPAPAASTSPAESLKAAIATDPWSTLNAENPRREDLDRARKNMAEIEKHAKTLGPEEAQKVFDAAGRGYFGPKQVRPTPPKEVPITGNTYAVRDQLAGIPGARFDRLSKTWKVPPEHAERARAIVAGKKPAGMVADQPETGKDAKNVSRLPA